MATHAQLVALINAGGVVEYRGRLCRVVADLPTAAQMAQDAADYSAVYQIGLGPGLPATGTNGQFVTFDNTTATGTAATTVTVPTVTPAVGSGTTLVGLGDSTTAPYVSNTYLDHIMLTMPAVTVLRNAGVGGNTTTDMLARFATDVAAYAPQLCSLLAGVNDIGQGVPHLTTVANITAIHAACEAIHCLLVLNTVPSVQAGRLNTWLRSYGAAHKLPVVDLFAVTVQADGTWVTAHGIDPHPSGAGTIAWAAAWKAIMDPLITPLPLRVAQANTDAGNLLQNALMTLDTDLDGVPDHWTAFAGVRTGKALSLIPDTLVDATGTRQLWQLVSAGNSPQNGTWGQDVASGAGVTGDVLEFTGRIIQSGTKTADWNLALSFPDAGGDAWIGLTGVHLDLDGYFAARVAIPAGAGGHVRVYVSVGALGTTLQWTQWALRNLTAQGAV